MDTKLFGTDGIRGRAGEFPLNAAALCAIGQAVGERLGGRILIGQDTRQSSPRILELLRYGIQKTAAEIEDAGVIPTPAIALLTMRYGYAGGVMISASHNPYEDNGVKVFGSDGRKLSDAAEAAIEKRISEILQAVPLRDSEAGDVGRDQRISAKNLTGWPERYERLLISHFPKGEWLKGMRIVVDCANGAMSIVAPALLLKLGANVVALNTEPTGMNINAGCGATHLESLTEGMREHRAAFGVAYDGDGDRSLFISASGRQIDGDAVLLIMARLLQSEGKLDPAIVVGTQMTNFSLERMLKEEGISLARVPVGDRFIYEEMLQSGAILGGEPSGHIIFSDFRLSGDGLLTTLKVAEAVVANCVSLDSLAGDWLPAPQLLKGVQVKRKLPLELLPQVREEMSEVERELQGRGRLVVRYSGTEPLLRVMIESDDAARNDRLMNGLLKTIAGALGSSL